MYLRKILDRCRAVSKRVDRPRALRQLPCYLRGCGNQFQTVAAGLSCGMALLLLKRRSWLGNVYVTADLHRERISFAPHPSQPIGVFTPTRLVVETDRGTVVEAWYLAIAGDRSSPVSELARSISYSGGRQPSPASIAG